MRGSYRAIQPVTLWRLIRAIVTLSVAVILSVMAPSQQAAEHASLHGSVRDPQGNPAADALVQLRSKDSTPPFAAHTNTEGRYSFTDVPAGVYVLHATLSPYTDAEIPSLFFRPGESRTLDLTLGPVNIPASNGDPSTVPQFFDQPQFTVSGVTDPTSLGGHGSDTVVRTRDNLAKETAGLSSTPTSRSVPGAKADVNYERTRDSLRVALAKHESAELHHQLGDVEEKLGDSLEAVRQYQRAAEMDPSESNLFDWGAELLLHRAPEPAREVFMKGNHRFPNSARTLIGLGAAEFSLGASAQAVKRVCEASDLNPQDSTAYLFLGKMQESEKTPSIENEIEEKLHRFVTLKPENAEANYYYALALWRKLRRDSSDIASLSRVESPLNTAVRLDPNYAAAYLQLGILHSEQHSYPKAISDFQQAIQADPHMEEAHYRLAQAYRLSGETDKANAELQLYQQSAKASAERVERERREIRQFVYTLRDPTSVPARQ